MSHQNVKNHLKGVSFTTTTPFGKDSKTVLHDELRKNIQAALNAGGESFIPCGNTGEYYSLSDKERVAVVETTVKTVGDNGIVIGGVSGSTKGAINRIKAYEAVGADGVMVHDPDHTYLHNEGLIKYYQKLAESTDMAVVLYKRGPELSLPVISMLSSVDNIVALKFAVNDIDEFSRTVREVPGDIVFTTGIAERFAPSFAMEGAKGFTTGIGSFIPKLVLELQDALERGDMESALQIRDRIRPFEELRDGMGPNNNLRAANNVPAVKYGLELAGLYGGPVREPLVELSEENKDRAKEYFEQMVEVDTISRTEA